MLLLPLSLVLAFWIATAHSHGKFTRIAVFVGDKTMLDRVWSTGIDFEGVSGKLGGMMEFVAGEHELYSLSALGIPYDIVIDDLALQYARNLSSRPMNALGFGYGSMGGFYTFTEVLRQLDSMRLLYPSLISQRDSIGRTVEGRALWAAKISDDPSNNEPNEPEVLYTALHHAREPQGMMTLLYYMWWLLENYPSNSTASYLVNNRQMWFIPVVNPDGYVYNQTMNPGGGGMHRKNRQIVGTSNLGVDLNRNYGPVYMWNASNGGSSTNANDDTYRGSAPFSEPETQTIDRFMRAHQVKACLNYHTYGNYLIYPWGYLSRENGDSLLYREWTYSMTFDNHYTNGTDQQTVAYSTRGNSDDYMFGDTTKSKTYTMTPEVGTTGFWPGSSEILPLAMQNLSQNKLLSFFAGQYTCLSSYRIQDAGGNGFPERGESFDFVASIRNRGLGSAINMSLTISSSSPSVQFATPLLVLGGLAARRDSLVVFQGVVASNAVTGIPVQIYLHFSDPEGFLRSDTVQMFLGTPTVAFADSGSNGVSNWSTGQSWGITSNAHSLPNAFSDSPSGNYLANTNNSLTLNSQINLAGYDHAQLKFWTKWAVEPSWDFATVEISTNNGSTWSTLRTALSHSGSGRSGGQQPAGTWGYESYTPGLTWVEQEADLSAYVNRQIKIRFRVATDGGEQRDGFYVDDIRLYGYTLNSPPPLGIPSLVSPPNGWVGQMTTTKLTWHKVSLAETYRVQVSIDSLFASIVLDDSSFVDTTMQFASTQPDEPVYWRVQARSVAGSGSWSAVWHFIMLNQVTQQYPIVGGWNMVAVPLALGDMLKATVYPMALSNAFAFVPGSGYTQRDTLANSVGYWVKFASPDSVVLTGTPVTRDTIDLDPGWGLIGGISVAVDTASIVQVPPGILGSAFFSYNGAYTPTDSLRSGVAYWVKSLAAGQLILFGGGDRRKPNAPIGGSVPSVNRREVKEK